MKRITDFDEYCSIVNSVKAVYSNSTLMKNRVNELIEENKLFYAGSENGVLLLEDDGPFYRGYYYWNDGPFDIEKTDKPILIEEPDMNGRRKESIDRFEGRLLDRGFVFLKTSIQWELRITGKQDYVLPEGYHLRYVDSESEYEQVLKLWDDYLDKTDVTDDRRHFFGKEGYRNIIVKKDDRVAGTLLSAWNRSRINTYHLVTDREFQGKGLARAVYCYLINDMADHGGGRILGWIASTNQPSIRLHEKLGFEKSGRTCRQYYLKEE